uniref:C2H2-type domain-containing protein n=1 Tax=Heterorhabditis bacteriophora TaxID=37862 RepID=A0A1I7X6L7_HETBA
MIDDEEQKGYTWEAGYAEGNIRTIKDSLASFNEAMCNGDFSLQNALQLALTNLKLFECMACERLLQTEGFACKTCHALFCFDCDVLLHDSLHVCPNCE